MMSEDTVYEGTDLSSQIAFYSSLIYATFYVGTTVALSIKLYGELSSTDNKYQRLKKFHKKVWYFIQKFWKKKSLYAPLFVHFIDTSTDIGVIILYYDMFKWEQTKGKSSIYNQGNAIGLFIGGLVVILFHRIFSAIQIYILHDKNIIDAVLQFFDLLIFRSLTISWKNNCSEPTSPQKMLQKWEALFEACPQIILQIIYILKSSGSENVGGNSGNNNNNNNNNAENEYLVIFSLIFSIVTLCSRFISDDAMNYHGHLVKKHKIDLFMLKFFRICDITTRLVTLSMIWIFFNSLVFLGYVVAYLFAVVILSYCRKRSVFV